MTRLVVSPRLTFQQPPAQRKALDPNTVDLLKLLAAFRGIAPAKMLTRLVDAEVARVCCVPKPIYDASLIGSCAGFIVPDEHFIPSAQSRDPPR